MPRIPRLRRLGALKIRQPPAPPPPDATAQVPPATETLADPPVAGPAPTAPAPAAPIPSGAEPAVAGAPAPEPATPAGFRERGRLRRRVRFLRQARELALRDLGGLVFDLHRFARSRDDLIAAKVTSLVRVDAEMRALEGALAQPRSITVLHEAGIEACPRCAAVHGSDARFCPNCGLALHRRAERLVGGLLAPSDESGAPAAATPAVSETVPDSASARVPDPAPAPAPAAAHVLAVDEPEPPTQVLGLDHADGERTVR